MNDVWAFVGSFMYGLGLAVLMGWLMRGSVGELVGGAENPTDEEGGEQK